MSSTAYLSRRLRSILFPCFLLFLLFFHVTSPHIFIIFCSDVIDNFSSYQTFLKQFCHIPLIIFIKHICGIFIFIIIFFQKINRLNLILCACPNVETVKIKPSKCVSLLYATADKKKKHCFWLIRLPFSKYWPSNIPDLHVNSSRLGTPNQLSLHFQLY